MVHILLIEDGLADRKAYVEIIQQADVDVTAVCLVEDAINLLQHGEKFDGLICDVAKARMTGLGFVEWLHDNYYNHPPLLLHSSQVWVHTFDLRAFQYTLGGQIRYRQKASVSDGATTPNYRYLRDFVAEIVNGVQAAA